MTIKVRELVVEDYPQIIELWKNTENIGISSADSPSAIKNFLDRNPGLSFVIMDDQKIFGTILGGHDGRRGAIYHLAIHNDYRGKGYGKELVDICLSAFLRLGIERCHIHVYADNQLGLQFWEKNGWFLRPELVLLSNDICKPVLVSR